jgi:hypothetical protein
MTGHRAAAHCRSRPETERRLLFKVVTPVYGLPKGGKPRNVLLPHQAAEALAAHLERSTRPRSPCRGSHQKVGRGRSRSSSPEIRAARATGQRSTRRPGCLRGGGPGYRTGPRTRAAPGCISSGAISPRCCCAAEWTSSASRNGLATTALRSHSTSTGTSCPTITRLRCGRSRRYSRPPSAQHQTANGGPAWRGRPLRARSSRSDNSRTLPVITWAGT